MVDVTAPLLRASAWDGLPDDAPARTPERYTAAAALSAIALRTARTVALTVRAGYAVEALPAMRRLFETAGHASGTRRTRPASTRRTGWPAAARADSPRTAFGDPDERRLWKLMSGQAHARLCAIGYALSVTGRRPCR